MAGLELERVGKRVAAVEAVRDVSLSIPEGEFVALLGPSGCGKTTILRMVAGFETVSTGTVRLGGRLVSAGDGLHVPPEQRRIGIVFQSYALWPHMTVAENVGFPLAVARVAGEDRRRRILRALDSVGLADLHARRPAELSGGQQQRVALARCLVMEPSVMLFDEPLANLDVHLRASMEEEFLRIHQALGATVLYITHDQAEAMALADRIAVMDQGRIAQIAAPEVLYRCPATPMVAGFIGLGGAVPCVVEGPVPDDSAPAQLRVRLDGVACTLRGMPDQLPGEALACLRPEDLELAEPGADALALCVERSTFKGQHHKVEALTRDGARLILHLRDRPRPGEVLHARITDGWVIPGRDEGPSASTSVAPCHAAVTQAR